MIGRALVLGLATLFLATPVVFADESSDAIEGVDISNEEEEEDEVYTEPVNWARKGTYLELSGLLIVEDFGSTTNRGTPDSGVTGSLGFRAGWRVGRPLAFEIAYQAVFNLLEEFDAHMLSIDAKYIMLPDRRYQPFIRTGFGSMMGDLPGEWTRKPAGTVSFETGFFWKIGIGLDYGITKHLAASLYGDYVIPTDEFHKLNFYALGAGLRYQF